MKLIYTGQHESIHGKSVFLAGCSPRKGQILKWREFAIEYFKQNHFNGTLIIPQPMDGNWPENYDDVVDWEDEYLQKSDVILFWVPRSIKDGIYGFTTNVEFGKYLHSGKIVYGRPHDSDNNRYLDYWYKKVYNEEPWFEFSPMIIDIVKRINKGLY